MTNAQVRYFYCKETNAVYRIVNNLRITMYYRSKKSFGVCCSSARDIYQMPTIKVGLFLLMREIWRSFYKKGFPNNLTGF